MMYENSMMYRGRENFTMLEDLYRKFANKPKNHKMMSKCSHRNWTLFNRHPWREFSQIDVTFCKIFLPFL